MRQYYFVSTTTEENKKDQFFVIAENIDEARSKVPLESGEKIESISLLGPINISLWGKFGEPEYDIKDFIIKG